MSKKTNQLDAATDAEAKNDSYLWPLADPVNGVSKKVSQAQAKQVFSTQNEKYVATGSEGTTLTIPALAGRQILMITRSGGPIYETGAAPEPDEFTWNDVDIVLGTATNAGEKFLILHRTY